MVAWFQLLFFFFVRWWKTQLWMQNKIDEAVEDCSELTREVSKEVWRRKKNLALEIK